MTKREKLLEALLNNPKSVRFGDACKIAEWLGFSPHGGKGSHRTYGKSDEPLLLNFQNRNGYILPYQAKQLFEKNMHPYLIETFWSEEDQAFLCIAPDLPGCSAAGETPLEAIREMQDAMESWLQACSNLGRPPPIPRAKPREAA